MNHDTLRLKKLDINTYKEAVIYMHKNCPACRAEGFEAPTRIKVTHGSRFIIATLNTVESDILKPNEAALSNYACELLGVKEGDTISLSHPKLLSSLSYIRSKVYNNELNEKQIRTIIKDLVAGYLSDIHIATFLTACAGGRLSQQEIFELTKAMIDVGDHLAWPSTMVVDKHCVGGLPGNRTSIIIVPIVTAFGLTMPKTSSRSITSPSGTADTMEVLAPVNLDIPAMRKVVEQENGCIVWGGSVALSPSDDILIRIEHALNIDGEGQLVASILSKKIAAGANHIIIDIPIGPTAKVRTPAMAEQLKKLLESIGKRFGVEVRVAFSDGQQPVGRGIGPALEAKDVLAVLQCQKHAPQNLREHALILAGQVLEFSPQVKLGTGRQLAEQILDSGQAWEKFQKICYAQGGMSEPPTAKYRHPITASIAGRVVAIDNRHLSRVAKLAGAPKSPAAGVELLTPLHTNVERNQPLFVIHSETPGELEYTVNYIHREHNLIKIEPQ